MACRCAYGRVAPKLDDLRPLGITSTATEPSNPEVLPERFGTPTSSLLALRPEPRPGDDACYVTAPANGGASNERPQVKHTKVEEVMTRLFVALKPTDSIHYAAQRLARNHISGAPVIDHGKAVGVISESDIIRAAFRPRRGLVTNFLEAVANAGHEDASQRLRATLVSSAMSAPAITARPEMTIQEAAALTQRHSVKRLPVVDDDGYLIGVISRADLVRDIEKSERALVVVH